MVESKKSQKPKKSQNTQNSSKNKLHDKLQTKLQDNRFRNALGIGIILLSVVLFIAVYTMDYEMPAILKFLVIVLVLGLTGFALQKMYKLDGGYGLLLIKTKKGLDLIDTLAHRYKNVWTAMADIGMVWGFGLLGSYSLYRQMKDAKEKHGLVYLACVSAVGICLLLFTAIFIAPVILPLALSIIANIELGKASGTITDVASTGWYQMFMTAALILGGYTIILIVGLLMYAVLVISNVINIIFSGAAPIEPSGTLLLPGINLPFWEGVLALVLLLVVHEASHGFLSRIANIRLDAAGIALFGFIPVGAFVDPDEKELQKRSKLEQTRVMVAGSTANLFTMFAVFFILLGFIMATMDFRDEGIIVLGGKGLPYDSKIITVNGIDLYSYVQAQMNTTNGTMPVLNISNITNQTGDMRAYAFVTDKGIYNITYGPNETSDIKMFIATKQGYVLHFIPGYEWLSFIFRTIALVLVLNFMVGIINLLPLPAFDGYRIVEINVPWKRAVTVLMYVILVCFLLNFLPWILR